MLRKEYGSDQELDADRVLEEVREREAEIYAWAAEELFDVLYDQDFSLEKLG